MYSHFIKHLILAFSLLFCFGPAYSQESVLELSKEVKLHLYVARFDSSKHSIEKCKVLDWVGICLIDKRPVFGTDWELPVSSLDSAKVEINNLLIGLEVSSMFNPWHGRIRQENFVLEKGEKGLMINGRFSDGAGAYVAQWRIISNKSIRTVLSDDEGVMNSLFPRFNRE
jgi:hypothetical protein